MRALLAAGVKPAEIGVITPYNAQARYRRDRGETEARWRRDGGEMEGRWRGDGAEIGVITPHNAQVLKLLEELQHETVANPNP